jgi:hypothetical protein
MNESTYNSIFKKGIQEWLSGIIISYGRQDKVREESVKLNFSPISSPAY